MNIGDTVTYPGSTATWIITDIGVTPGRTLSGGYKESDWHWVELKHADGSYPDFRNRVSESSIVQVVS